MSNLSFDLDDAAIRAATATALLTAMSSESRDRLIKQAIQAVLDPSPHAWDKGKSPLEQAFERAVRDAVEAEARRLVAEEATIQARLQSLVRAATEKMLSADPERMAQRMADAFIDSLRRD